MKESLNKHKLKRFYKNQIAILDLCIKTKCYECGGFNADPYEDCEIYKCPLYPFRIGRGNCRSQDFKPTFKEVKRLFNAKGNCTKDHWLEYFQKEKLARENGDSKSNLQSEGGGQNE